MVQVIRTGPIDTNCLIVDLGEDKVFVVDPACCSFCRDEFKVTDYLQKEKKHPVAVVLTHGHFDHVAGLPALKKIYPDIPVLIHKADSFLIGKESAQTQEKDLLAVGFEEFLEEVRALPSADGFLEEKKSLFDCLGAFGEELSETVKSSLKNWEVLHTPGHTFGSICLYNRPENTLLSGDTVFYGSCGRTDIGGSAALMEKSLKKIKETVDKNALVYPGHDFCGFALSEFFF